MKTLIVEDDFTSRVIIHEFLKEFGPAHIAVNGAEAIVAMRSALSSGEPYDLICLDVMLPEMHGQEALKLMRAYESEACLQPGKRAKIFMTTSVSDSDTVMQALREGCDAYLVKPIYKSKLTNQLRQHGLTK